MEVEEGEMGEEDAPAPWYVKLSSKKKFNVHYCSLVTLIKTDVTFYSSSIPIDYNLYRKFWTLQDYFRNPVQCYDKFSWMTFVKVT